MGIMGTGSSTGHANLLGATRQMCERSFDKPTGQHCQHQVGGYYQ
jgi:hypothetical protein